MTDIGVVLLDWSIVVGWRRRWGRRHRVQRMTSSWRGLSVSYDRLVPVLHLLHFGVAFVDWREGALGGAVVAAGETG